MLYKNYNQGNPFIGDYFSFSKSVFRQKLFQSRIHTRGEPTIIGHNANGNLSQVIKSSFGEWIERVSLQKDTYRGTEFVEAFGLITGDIIKVPKERILLIGTFNDSCGVSAHLDSSNSIKSSYLEYFERISLIFNWLSKSKGIEINLNNHKNDSLDELLYKIHNFVEEVFVYDISIHDKVKVILSLGRGKYYKGIGLNADFNGEKALLGSLDEMLQGFSNKWSKNYSKNIIDDTKQFNHKNSKNNDIYMINYNKLTPNELIEEFSYLQGEQCIEVSEILRYKERFNMCNIIKVSEDIGYEPYCAFIPSLLNNSSVKITRIFSPNCYPHMYPPLFTEEESSISFCKDITVFPNKYKGIPFP